MTFGKANTSINGHIQEIIIFNLRRLKKKRESLSLSLRERTFCRIFWGIVIVLSVTFLVTRCGLQQPSVRVLPPFLRDGWRPGERTRSPHVHTVETGDAQAMDVSLNIVSGMGAKEEIILTFDDVTHLAPRASVVVSRRLRGAMNTPGVCVVAFPHRKIRDRTSPPFVVVEFTDGIEHVHPDRIARAPKSQAGDQYVLF